MVRLEIDREELADVWQLERRHTAKLLFVEVWPGERVLAELESVADVGWYIDVWGRQARLVLVSDDGRPVDADEELDLDADQLAKLITQVVYHDHNSDLSLNRVYYPMSYASKDQFQRLITSAEAKSAKRVRQRRRRARRGSAAGPQPPAPAR